MLKRNFRLKKESDFKRIYRNGKKIHGIFFDIIYLQNKDRNRFGVTVTTKTINKATKRNQIKRLLHGFILKSKNFWPENHDIIIKIKKEIQSSEKTKAQNEIKTLFRKIR